MSVWKWSQTAASNATADSTINFREGQAPGSVNNASRALMAAVAKYRDDMSGNLETGGTSTAYTLATNQALTALTDGFKVAARMNVTSGTAPTLNVDSLGAKAIQSVAGTAIPDAALLANSIHAFTYDSDEDAWIVHGFANALFPVDNPDLVAIEALAGTAGLLKKTAANTWALDDGSAQITIVAEGHGDVLLPGVLADVQIPFACTITAASAFADQTGSVVIDIWKDSYANFPANDADSITASAPITIAAGTKSQDTTLTGWTTSIAAGDVLRFNIDSVSAITRLTVSLKVKRYG